MSKTPDSGGQQPLPLVVGLNGCDKIEPGNWDAFVNAPSPEKEESIRRRCHDVTDKLTQATGLGANHIEHYSALRRYRLIPLLTAVIRHAVTGFKLDSVQPQDPFELADPEAREFANQERQRLKAARPPAPNFGQVWEELGKQIPMDVLGKMKAKYQEERARPPRIAFLGKAGVGKTTTINTLFNAGWKTSHTLPGTTDAQVKDFELASGGTLSAVDLPGYGRSIKEDRDYEAIYRDVLPGCDLILLVIQANARDLSDDQEMISKLMEWFKYSPQRP